MKKKLNDVTGNDNEPVVPKAVKADTLAKAFVSLIPHMMGSLRRHLRTAEGVELRVGEFRMMMAIAMEPHLSVSDAAEVMGAMLPSASKVADELERSGLIKRHADRTDRRRALLSLTPMGVEVLKTVQCAAEEHFAAIFKPLTAHERAFLLCAAEALRPLFRSGIRTIKQRKKLHSNIFSMERTGILS